MEYWNTCKELPWLGDNAIFMKRDFSGKKASGLRKVGSTVEVVESVFAESDWAFEIEDMVYGLRCAIRNFIDYRPCHNISPIAGSEEEVGLMKEAIKWLEEE